MDCEFHCSIRLKGSVKKSKHRLKECCTTVKTVLSNNPEYGVLVKGTGGLRKMRVRVPSLNVGKSGGYRLIYKALVIDEVWKIALLETYSKSTREDLSSTEYHAVMREADDIFQRSEETTWETL